jgi:hypothetical protein
MTRAGIPEQANRCPWLYGVDVNRASATPLRRTKGPELDELLAQN